MEYNLSNLLVTETQAFQQRLQYPDGDEIDSIAMRAELLYGHVLRLQESNIAPNVVTDEVVEIIRRLFETLLTFSEELHYSSVDSAYQARTPLLNQQGRPRYDLPREQLTYFIEKGFSCTQMCSMLGVSLSTIRRRMKEYGLAIRETYSQISDSDFNTKGQYFVS